MSCEQIRNELAAYSEGFLKPPEAAKVAQHLSICEACRAEADRLTGVWELLADDEPVEVPPDLARRTLERARDEGRSGLSRVPRFPTWYRWAALALASAAAVLIIFGDFDLHRTSREAPQLASLSDEERQVVANLDLLEEYDIIKYFDLLEKIDLSEHQDVVREQ